MADKVEDLYYGDVRLDNLEAAITNLIYERVAGQKITYAAVIGILMKIVVNLTKQITEED